MILDTVSEPVFAAMVGGFGGVLLGLAARLGRFCTMGSIEDYLYGGSDIRLRMWGLAIAVATLGSFALVASGNLDLSTTIYHSGAWNPLGSVLGGLLFGYGMALAGNCGFGALARFGGGDLRSFVIVLVMGIAAYATLSGPLALARVVMFDSTALSLTHTGFADLLGALFGGGAAVWGLLIGLVLLVLTCSSRAFLADRAALFWSSVVGLAIVTGWAGTGYIAREGFEGMQAVSHTFSSPLGESILYVMTSSGGGISFGVGSVAGVVAGAFVGSLIKGHFRWEACEDPRELRRQILGAAMMGVGAVIALGCTIGQGISAFSVLAFSAPVTFASIFAGSAFGLKQLISGFGLGREA